MSPLDDLKRRFEGKTVLRVEPPDADEAIAKFILDDGTAFVLHATDLGYWTRDTAPHHEGPYPTLTSMMEQYFQTGARTPNFDTDHATVLWSLKLLTLISPDQKYVYHLPVENLTDPELRIASSDIGRNLLGEAALLGDAWSELFNDKNPDCPRELWMPAQT